MKKRKRTDTTPHYDPEALKRNIETCKRNICRMEEAIIKERGTISELERFLVLAEAGR